MIIQTVLENASLIFKLQELPTKTFKKNGMRFDISFYQNDDILISTIDMKAMLGLMRMDSIIITTPAKDLPVFSMDAIKVMGNKTFLADFYNTLVSQDERTSDTVLATKFSHLPDFKRESRWYDSILLPNSIAKKNKNLYLEGMASTIFDYYMDWFNHANEVDPEEKKQKTKEYVDNLLTKGGPSTEQFQKLFGNETTINLYYELFGVK